MKTSTQRAFHAQAHEFLCGWIRDARRWRRDGWTRSEVIRALRGAGLGDVTIAAVVAALGPARFVFQGEPGVVSAGLVSFGGDTFPPSAAAGDLAAAIDGARWSS